MLYEEEKLTWLEEANKFVSYFVSEEKLRRWKKLMEGESPSFCKTRL